MIRWCLLPRNHLHPHLDKRSGHLLGCCRCHCRSHHLHRYTALGHLGRHRCLHHRNPRLRHTALLVVYKPLWEHAHQHSHPDLDPDTKVLH